MAYLRTEKWKNGDTTTPVNFYTCDITGNEICESDGWIGNDEIHISNSGFEILLEQWIKRNSNNCGAPIIIDYLEKRLTNKIKKDRYISKQLRIDILNKYRHTCVICGSVEKLEIDHIIPVSKMGISEFSNLQVLCKSCNIKKSNKIHI
jgi:hypothetical protein